MSYAKHMPKIDSILSDSAICAECGAAIKFHGDIWFDAHFEGPSSNEDTATVRSCNGVSTPFRAHQIKRTI